MTRVKLTKDDFYKSYDNDTNTDILVIDSEHNKDEIENQILEDHFNIDRINDMMAELLIEQPLELWLAASITWRKEAKLYEEYFDAVNISDAISIVGDWKKKADELDRLMTDEYVNALQENKELEEELHYWADVGKSLKKDLEDEVMTKLKAWDKLAKIESFTNLHLRLMVFTSGGDKTIIEAYNELKAMIEEKK